MLLSWLLLLIFLALHDAFAYARDAQLPLDLDHDLSQSPPLRVAIVGAGAAGSSAAYHLFRFSAPSSAKPVITVFESLPRIGGRSCTVDALNSPQHPTELGASIFVKTNPILYNAS